MITPYMRLAASVLVLTLGLTGCASWVSVTNVSEHPNAKGLRYSLTTPYLLMNPASDGTVTYEWLSLPDSSKQYAVKTHSILSTYSLEMTIEHAILKKITAKPDGSTLASTALTQAGTVLEAREKAQAKADETGATAAKSEQDELKKALATAEEAERKAKIELDKAQATVDFLNGQKDPDQKQVLAAGLALKLADVEHKAAAQEVARLKALVPSLASASAAANTGAKTGDITVASPAPTAWGPLLFRVIQTDGKVELRAISQQIPFATYGEREAVSGAAGTAQTVEFAPTWNSTERALTLKATAKNVQVVAERIVLNRDKKPFESETTWKPGDDGETFTVTFDPALATGSYAMQFQYQLKKDQKPLDAVVSFVVP